MKHIAESVWKKSRDTVIIMLIILLGTVGVCSWFQWYRDTLIMILRR